MSDLKEVVADSFSRYAGNVILDRAICDVRDMLKPSARMLMYSQIHITKNIDTKPFVKSARVVGDCLGHYYTHGDSSCYGTYMRMSKPFAMRYPLEDCQGNNGTITETSDEAHMRYTELRVSHIGMSLFESIEKDTIPTWYDNFDETEQYPKILPSKGFYNIVNGSTGIGVSLSASIPQFNLREINDALIVLIDDPNYTVSILPDFATGAILINPAEVLESLKCGYGSACKLRSVVEYDKAQRAFIVKEVPYGVYTNTISNEITKLIEEHPDCGIERINDGSGKTPDYMIYLSKNANPDKALKLLYKETSLESYFTINMNVLVEDGRTPKLLGLKEMLQAHIDHEKVVYRRGFEYDLRKIESRIHIIDGLMICLAKIDEVVHTIKSSSSTADASFALQKNFLLDADQAKAVLDMKLSRLAHLEVKKLEDERKDLLNEDARIHNILDNDTLFNEELKKGWRLVADKYGDARRTKVVSLTSNGDEPVEIRKLQVSLTNQNNVFVSETSTLYTQRRGGVGNKLRTDTGEYIIGSCSLDSNEELLFFTSDGNVYHCSAAALPIGEKSALSSYIPLKEWEHICALTAGSKENIDQYIIFITRNGFIKKSSMSEYNINRNVGLRALTLNEGDEIVDVLFTKDEKLGILTEGGNFLIITTDDVRPIGRIAQGIRAIKLNEDDHVIASHIIPASTKFIVSISGNGLFKRTVISEFAPQGKNTKGAKLQKLNDGDWMADFMPFDNETEICIASSRTCIKLTVNDIPIFGKGALGNKSIKLAPEDNVVRILMN